MHFYGIGLQETLNLPARAFWLMNAQIPRIRAERELREFGSMISQRNGEAITDHRSALLAEMGEVLVSNPEVQLHEERDEEGFDLLKRMAQGLA